MDPDGTVVVDGADATVEIRASEVSRAVSLVAANPGVRDEMRRRQREWAEHRGGGVLEGRDIGTVVFPDAEVKFFLTATPEIRAQRRFDELAEKGNPVSYEGTLEDVKRRDTADTERPVSPLRRADDAVLIDSTGRSIDDVIDEMARVVETRTGSGS